MRKISFAEFEKFKYCGTGNGAKRRFYLPLHFEISSLALKIPVPPKYCDARLAQDIIHLVCAKMMHGFYPPPAPHLRILGGKSITTTPPTPSPFGAYVLNG